jgi:hypothetical protein
MILAEHGGMAGIEIPSPWMESPFTSADHPSASFSVKEKLSADSNPQNLKASSGIRILTPSSARSP